MTQVAASIADPVPAATQIPAAPPGRPNILPALNAAAIVIAGLYLGREILVPLTLAVLLAFVLAPLVVLLTRARLGRGPSVLLVVAFAFLVIAGLGLLVGRQATDLAQGLPAYQDTIKEKMKSLAVGGEVLGRLERSLREMVGGVAKGDAPAPIAGQSRTTAQVTVTPTTPAPAPSPAPAPDAAPAIDASSALVIVQTVVAPVLGPLATAGIVAIFAIFILMAREDLRDRLVRLLGRADLHRSILAMNDAASRLSRYFLFQLMLNASFGVFVAVGLWIAGLPSPALWGILAGCMRFVPFIGTAIAVLPPVLLAIVVSPGWSLCFIVLGLFIVTDMLVSQIVEPLVYGHSTGLSPFAIIVSALFWAFLWGPVGLLLATPLTVCLVVLGRHVEALAFLEVMLGDRPPLEPPETFYQRALEKNGRDLAREAARTIEGSSLVDYYDKVALPGLALAQADMAQAELAMSEQAMSEGRAGSLDTDRLDGVHQQIETLVAGLQPKPAHGPALERDALPPEWQRDGSVLCLPARGQLDDLAAAMAAQVLQSAGFGARARSNDLLGSGRDDDPALAGVALCCLSVLDSGSSPSAVRYLLRRIQRQMPEAVIIVGLWHADDQSPLLKALRAEGESETIVLSLSQLVADARVAAERAAQTVAA